jgi:hypothetical protein
MAMQFTFTNIIQFFAAVSPLLLGFFLIMGSVFNQNLKGVIYLGGVLIASVINLLISNMIGKTTNTAEPDSCNLINFPFINNNYSCPAFNTMFISFTLAYLVLPMIYNSKINYVVLSTLLLLLLVDGITRLIKGCNDFIDLTTGMVIGLLLGGAQFSIMHYTKHDDLLYYDDLLSNNVVCERPKKQTFKCSVYKNGELIKSL